MRAAKLERNRHKKACIIAVHPMRKIGALKLSRSKQIEHNELAKMERVIKNAKL
jgi:hypothetical protein